MIHVLTTKIWTTLLEHLQQSFQIFACLESEQCILPFTYLLFRIHFLTDSLSFSPSHLNIISLFILYSFFLSSFIFPVFIPNNYIFQTKMLYPQYFLQYVHKNHIKILCGKLLLILIRTHH